MPLNLACEHGSEAIVELLLKHGAKIQADAEGLYPQHLVARSMQPPQLLLLLKRYGADLDQVDKLYGWTPLVHAASEGNVACLQALLDSGADPGIVDEKDLPALYYAAWEGHLECMELLRPYNKRTHASRPLKPQPAASPQLLGSGRSAGPMAVDPDAIPVLELPPPIIPLRRYGHNFLDTKTLVQISFEDAQPLVFFHDGKYPAARLTISSKASDLIPKNIILPFQEDTRLVSFQVDNIDAFTLDLDVFPTYGAKVIAKTVALPNTFRFAHVSSGRVCLPLFDPRLRAIGQISFDTHVVKPFQGRPLEITAFETYWKATSQLDSATDGGGISSSATAATVAAAASFITGSSLSGDFVQLFVQHTSDAVPVLWPTWTVPCGDGVDVPISRLTHAQFAAATSRLPNREHLSSLPSLPLERVADAHALLATTGVTLAEALAILPPGMNVNLNVIYPSAEEERTLGLGPTPDINVAVDAVLAVVFDHARAQRASGGSDKVMRGVVFTSYNPMVCTALNWKQPNFPVFLCNDLGAEEEKQKVGGTVAVQSTFGFIRSSGRRTSSIKEVVRVAVSNNFMGLICSSRLLVRNFFPFYSFCFNPLNRSH